MRTANASSYAKRWAEGHVYLKLCADSLSDGDYSAAINWLHQAHNLGRDNVRLHIVTHLRYVQFALHERNYRRAFGHAFWALSSPLMVLIKRKKRTSDVGDWKPAPLRIASAQPPDGFCDAPVAVSPPTREGPNLV